jgi:hypothetical protein
MDTDALIKLTKAAAKEAVCGEYTVVLAPAVERESVEEGKAAGYADAVVIEENLRAGRLSTVRPRRSSKTERLLRDLAIVGGEADTLRLYRAGRADLIVSDDGRFLGILDALNVPYATPGALIAALVRRRAVSVAEGSAFLEALVGMVSEAEYLETRRVLEEE